jgi:hypothetical protein
VLLVAVPVAYLVTDPRNQGGYNFNYSVELIGAHWLGVAAVILLGLAVWMTLSAARQRSRRPESPGPPEPPGPAAPPDLDAPEPAPGGARVGSPR